MRVFKTKSFSRFCRKAGLDDDQLVKAVEEMAAGLIDADLGGEVFKQRIARKGQGKSGGFRTILYFRSEHRTVFAHGFAKKDKDNIEPDDLVGYRQLARVAMGLDDDEIVALVLQGLWWEVKNDEGEV
jgi:hypothetical protein